MRMPSRKFLIVSSVITWGIFLSLLVQGGCAGLPRTPQHLLGSSEITTQELVRSAARLKQQELTTQKQEQRLAALFLRVDRVLDSAAVCLSRADKDGAILWISMATGYFDEIRAILLEADADSLKIGGDE